MSSINQDCPNDHDNEAYWGFTSSELGPADCKVTLLNPPTGPDCKGSPGNRILEVEYRGKTYMEKKASPKKNSLSVTDDTS